MLKWLLALGIDLRQTDKFGSTALETAVKSDNAKAIEILLRAGANVNEKSRMGEALGYARTREVAMILLEAGADPQELSSEGRRAILGYPPEPDETLLRVSREEFQRYRSRRFGRRNPTVMNNPFWEGMIRSGVNAYQATMHIAGNWNYSARRSPVWCAQRFGQSLTFLPDGRIVQVAGEHEDYYDPDFCIYNDVFVHDPKGNITIYGYPKSVFLPTDFHTATLIGGHLYLIGSLGYLGSRQFGATPVYHLDVNTFQIERLETTGNPPGWLYKHRAVQSSAYEIQVTGGTLVTNTDGKESYTENADMFTLNIKTMVWARVERN